MRADNVRSAMTFVARGEAPLGIVYATDALIDKKVRVVATFPDNSHAPITYPAAATATAGPDAAAISRLLAQHEAAPIVEQIWIPGAREMKSSHTLRAAVALALGLAVSPCIRR